MKHVSKYKFRTRQFERAVVPGSAREHEEPGLPGTIDFQAEPENDKDKGNKLEKWLRENTVIPPKNDREGVCYIYMSRTSACSVTIDHKTLRDNQSATDPLRYQKTAIVKVQPPGQIPKALQQVLQKYGYAPI